MIFQLRAHQSVDHAECKRKTQYESIFLKHTEHFDFYNPLLSVPQV